jgi:glycine oxidase
LSPSGTALGSIAIAGAGLIGMSLAWRLAQAGFRVSVFDRGEVGSEASWAGAGMLSPGGEVDRACPLASLALESRRMYREFVRELEQSSGREIDYQECGALDLAYSEEELGDLKARAGVQQSLGIESKPLTAEQIRRFWPIVRTDGLAGGRFYPEDGLVNPRDTMAALCVVCRPTGGGGNTKVSGPHIPCFYLEGDVDLLLVSQNTGR